MYSLKVIQAELEFKPRLSGFRHLHLTTTYTASIIFYYQIVKSDLASVHRTRDSTVFPGGRQSLRIDKC